MFVGEEIHPDKLIDKVLGCLDSFGRMVVLLLESSYSLGGIYNSYLFLIFGKHRHGTSYHNAF